MDTMTAVIEISQVWSGSILAVFSIFWFLEDQEKDRAITETHIKQQQKQPT